MSSSEDCTCDRCQQTNQIEEKRYHNPINTNRRQDIRHHGKRRFPPTKKDLFPKDISLKPKPNKKFQYNNFPNFVLFPQDKHDHKPPPTATKPKIYDHNPLTKINVNTTSAIENPFHAVGQSQRQKLMKDSPNPSTVENEAYKTSLPLTDRDRRVEGLRGQFAKQQRKRSVSNLDENFVLNFMNPENEKRQASASQEKEEK